MAAGPIAERNQGKLFTAEYLSIIKFIYSSDATIYVGGLDDKVTETLLWELFVQAGPVGKLLLRTWYDILLLVLLPYFSECPHAERSSHPNTSRLWFRGISF